MPGLSQPLQVQVLSVRRTPQPFALLPPQRAALARALSQTQRPRSALRQSCSHPIPAAASSPADGSLLKCGLFCRPCEVARAPGRTGRPVLRPCTGLVRAWAGLRPSPRPACIFLFKLLRNAQLSFWKSGHLFCVHHHRQVSRPPRAKERSHERRTGGGTTDLTSGKQASNTDLTIGGRAAATLYT